MVYADCRRTGRAEDDNVIEAFASDRADQSLRTCPNGANHVQQDKQYRASRGFTLPVATADTATLITAAQAALAAIWRDGYPYRKAGVMLVDLVKASSVGTAIFERRDDSRSLSRMRALDGLNARFGLDAITTSPAW